MIGRFPVFSRLHCILESFIMEVGMGKSHHIKREESR